MISWMTGQIISMLFFLFQQNSSPAHAQMIVTPTSFAQ